MFVDDDQNQQTAKTPTQPAEEVLPDAQEALNYWVGHLESTGGLFGFSEVNAEDDRGTGSSCCELLFASRPDTS